MPRIDEALAPALDRLRDELAQYGVRVRFTSGYRSLREQASVYQRKGPAMAAPPGWSYHNYGLAVDVSISPERWDIFGAVAEAMGFRWGARFSTPEPWHIDAGSVLTIDQAARWFDRGQYLVGV